MAARVFDARRRITSDAIDSLRQGVSAVLGFKDRQTGFIGIWTTTPDEHEPKDDLDTILIQGHLMHGSPDDEKTFYPLIGVQIANSHSHELWELLVGLLRAGDVLQLRGVQLSGSRFSPRLELHRGTVFHATFVLGD
jgi:hypothetical protein